VVPYKGAGAALIDVEGGHVDLMCTQVSTAIQPINANLVKPYGVILKNRVRELPTVPTLEEQKFHGFDLPVWNGIWTVKGTPPETVASLRKALQQAIADPKFVEDMSLISVVPVAQNRATPDSLEKRLQQDMIRWKFLSQTQSND